MNVVILVPRRADGGERDRLWAFCRDWWERDHPDWRIVEGREAGEGPFNRSAAINDAAREAGDWDVAVIIDADVVCNAQAVRAGVARAVGNGQDVGAHIVVTHNERIMLSKAGTQKVLAGYRGPWKEKGMVDRTWPDSVSCSVVVPRSVWDKVGGFDERFVGWGFEDTAFTLAAEHVTGELLGIVHSECFHLFHAKQPDSRLNSPTYRANLALKERYVNAFGDNAAMSDLLAPVRGRSTAPAMPDTTIPRILHRTVPAETTEQVEAWWARFAELHPGWDLRTYREPIDPVDWPNTGHLFDRCANGAQKAGLIRLEALWTWGGVYVDSDVEPLRSLEPLLHVPAFAAWEDETTIPDAVLGARPLHPAIEACIDKARRVIEGGGDAWQSGPGVTTETLQGRDDVLVLPPGAFYPWHYLQKHKAGDARPPYAFVAHHWHHSWGTKQQRSSIEQRQRQ